MMSKRELTAFLVATLFAATTYTRPAQGAEPAQIDVVELTVDSAQDGLRSRRYTARRLAEAFLAR